MCLEIQNARVGRKQSMTKHNLLIIYNENYSAAI